MSARPRPGDRIDFATAGRVHVVATVDAVGRCVRVVTACGLVDDGEEPEVGAERTKRPLDCAACRLAADAT